MDINLPKLARQALNSIDRFLHNTDKNQISDPMHVQEKLPKSAIMVEELQTKSQNFKSDIKDYIKHPMRAILGGSLIGLGSIATVALFPLSLLGTGVGLTIGLIVKEASKTQNQPAGIQAGRMGAITGLAIGSLGTAGLVMVGLKLLKESGEKDQNASFLTSEKDREINELLSELSKLHGDIDPAELPRKDKFTHLANPLSDTKDAYFKRFEKDVPLDDSQVDEILNDLEKTEKKRPKLEKKPLDNAYSEMLKSLLKDYKYHGEMSSEDVKAMLIQHPKNSSLIHYDTKRDSLAISFINKNQSLESIYIRDENQLKQIQENWTSLGLTFI